MKNHKTITKKVVELESVTCDCCNKEYLATAENLMELNEFHHIEFVGGYDSIFGDGSKVTADICQHCLKERLGDILNIS